MGEDNLSFWTCAQSFWHFEVNKICSIQFIIRFQYVCMTCVYVPNKIWFIEGPYSSFMQKRGIFPLEIIRITLNVIRKHTNRQLFMLLLILEHPNNEYLHLPSHDFNHIQYNGSYTQQCQSEIIFKFFLCSLLCRNLITSVSCKHLFHTLTIVFGICINLVIQNYSQNCHFKLFF
jgi:hypothetical protein